MDGVRGIQGVKKSGIAIDLRLIAAFFLFQENVAICPFVGRQFVVDDPADALVEEAAVNDGALERTAGKAIQSPFGVGVFVRSKNPAAALIGQGTIEGGDRLGAGRWEIRRGDAGVAQASVEAAGVPGEGFDAGHGLQHGVDGDADAA